MQSDRAVQSDRAYLDHAATTALLPEAAEAWRETASRVGNPSSLHAAGRASRRVVEEARESIADDLRVLHPDWSDRQLHDLMLGQGSPAPRHLRTLLGI